MDTAKDMHKVYSKTATIDLMKNRSRKCVQLEQLIKVNGYWAQKDINRLKHMIMQIDAVLAARALEDPLF